MAGPLLKRAGVIVWLPPRGDGRHPLSGDARLLALRPASGRLDTASVDGLSDARQVTLVVDARDVSLIGVTLPPLSGARLARALPNAVEDLLLQDPAACVLALGPTLPDGRRLVAACDRAWLEGAVAAFAKRGVAVNAIWPASLALPPQAGWTMACLHDGLALRRGELDGMGWTAGPEDAGRAEAVAALLRLAGPPPSLHVLIEDERWRAPVERGLAQAGVSATIAPLDAAAASPIDLMPPMRGRLRATALTRVDWRAWRWPVGLAAAGLVAGVAGLNLHWAKLSREEAALRAALERGFREAMPQATVIVDPVLQLRRHVAALRAGGGSAGPDDFVPMMTRVAQALGPQATDALAGAEWRDGSLRLRLRPAVLEGGDAARDRVRQALAAAGMTVEFDAGREPVAVVRVQR